MEIQDRIITNLTEKEAWILREGLHNILYLGSCKPEVQKIFEVWCISAGYKPDILILGTSFSTWLAYSLLLHTERELINFK